MVQVRVMRMLVTQGLMAMPVGMGFRYRTIVIVSMVLVMDVHVLVLERFMFVLVFMALRDVQPYSHSHERPGDNELDRQALVEHEKRRQCPYEGRG